METILSTKILGTKVSTEESSKVLQYIIRRLKSRREKFYIVTPNPEIMTYAMRNRTYQEGLNGAEVALPDGVGVLVASKLLKKGVRERISGVDFMVMMVRECAKEGLTVGFLGGRGNVAKRTADCLSELYPGLKVSFAEEEWNVKKIANGKWEKDDGERLGHIDVLFVAMGFPKQEEWIVKNLSDIPATAAMGVGGAFDYISGRVVRAPRILRQAGLEWFFRLLIEPWRLKRQLVLPIFVYYIIRARLFGEKDEKRYT